MLFKAILDGIETVLKADEAVNALIKVYRQYAIEPGVMAVPAVVIGSSRALKLDEEFLSDSAGSHPVLWQVSIGIMCLSRRYPLPAQVIKAAEEVDALQAAVFTALNNDPTQGEVCEQSWIDSIREVVLLNGEYIGYEINLVLQKFEV